MSPQKTTKRTKAHPAARPAREDKTKRPKPKPAKTKKPASKTPKTQAVLLDKIRSERARLEQSIAMLSEAQLTQPGVVEESSVKDILAHLTVWEQRLMQRVTGKPEFGADMGTREFNEYIFRELRNRPLSTVQSEFQTSYRYVLRVARGLSDAEVKKWWMAFAYNTHGHYRWATQHIRRWIKANKISP